MENRERNVILSLELHLFFARIMKEHSLFLEAGFTPQNAALAKRAERCKEEFEKLLQRTVKLSDGIIGEDVLSSGEIITEFTRRAEKQTQQFTGIQIDGEITLAQSRLTCGKNPKISEELARNVRALNQTAIRLLDDLIGFKESILNDVRSCRIFTLNYPLLIEHILREAKLYRRFVVNLERGSGFGIESMKQTEQFWNRIMMEHAMFIRGLLDPTEEKLICAADDFAKDYSRLLAKSREANDATLSLKETLKFREFKTAGTRGIQNCEIRSIILPLLADHVLREANHFIRLLK